MIQRWGIRLLFTLLTIVIAHAQSNEQFRTALARARKAGIDSSFLSRISASSASGFVERAVRINVTNYASVPDYSSQYNKKSVREVKAFMKTHRKLLERAQKATSVPKEFIASILWIESKCGQVVGQYHVPSVFLSLTLASDSVYVQQSLDHVVTRARADTINIDSTRALIQRRAKVKVKWAYKELRELEKIHERKVMNVVDLRGSWAGAFGFPQFIPSSYVQWAVDGDKDGDIDLYSLADASHSIGNYLKANGWGSKPSARKKAIHHYNNSDAYVNAVYTLANKLQSKGKKRR